MSPQALAALHAACFTAPPPWSADIFAALLAEPACHLVTARSGFALFRRVLDEAELLTLAVHPGARRQGQGRTLLVQGLEEMRAQGARACFLEVAADNAPACALYAAHGFELQGRRPGYYCAPGAAPVDALLMRATLDPVGG